MLPRRARRALEWVGKNDGGVGVVYNESRRGVEAVGDDTRCSREVVS